jgi:hypothetical protein
VWRCTPPGGRTVLSEVCGRFKSAFARFRHAAPRNQHPRSRVSSRRLREIDPRLGGSSAVEQISEKRDRGGRIPGFRYSPRPCVT